jgi:thymidylate synthase ThyX
VISQERIKEYLDAGQMDVQIIADSISEAGKRITTFQLKYWRAIHSEVMTHRVFSRNASSSRAIPIGKMIKQVRENPAMPIHWGANQKGMQAKEELSFTGSVKEHWRLSSDSAIERAGLMSDWGLHKQVVNRILEPYQHIHVVLTATEFDNWEELRYHEDAQPEIWLLAKLMKEAQEKSEPKLLKAGEWHMPYVLDEEKEIYSIEDQLKISTARCCRVSYINHGMDKICVEKDFELYDDLVGARPLHASPTEHQARPENKIEFGLHSNFKGWVQHRKILEKSIYNK